MVSRVWSVSCGRLKQLDDIELTWCSDCVTFHSPSKHTSKFKTFGIGSWITEFTPNHPQGTHAGGRLGGAAKTIAGFGPLSNVSSRAAITEETLNNRDKLREMEGGPEILTASGNWQFVGAGSDAKNRQAFENRRKGASDWINGKNPPTDEQRLSGYTIAETIASSPPEKETLFRGIRTSMSVDEVEGTYVQGGSFDLLPSSFTTDQNVGNRFSAASRGRTGAPVMFELEPGSQAFNLEAISGSAAFAGERERITMGRYEVVSVTRQQIPQSGGRSDDGVRVKIRQVNDFGDVGTQPSVGTPPTRKRPDPIPNVDTPKPPRRKANPKPPASTTTPNIPAGWVVRSKTSSGRTLIQGPGGAVRVVG